MSSLRRRSSTISIRIFIIIAAVLVVILLAAIAAFVVVRRRYKREQQQLAQQPAPNNNASHPQIYSAADSNDNNDRRNLRPSTGHQRSFNRCFPPSTTARTKVVEPGQESNNLRSAPRFDSLPHASSMSYSPRSADQTATSRPTHSQPVSTEHPPMPKITVTQQGSPTIRACFGSRFTSTPQTSDTSDTSADGIGGDSRSLEPVNPDFAELLAARGTQGGDFPALIRSEAGTLDSGSSVAEAAGNDTATRLTKKGVSKSKTNPACERGRPQTRTGESFQRKIGRPKVREKAWSRIDNALEGGSKEPKRRKTEGEALELATLPPSTFKRTITPPN